MRRWLGSAGRVLLQQFGLYQAFLLRRGYLSEVGWVRSSRERAPVTRDGAPIPWITYPALSFLAPRVFPSMDVFEYGSGNSTLWWAERVRSVHACEHDPDWHEHVRRRLPPNAGITHHALEAGGAYCREAVTRGRRYDIVVIDGRDRVNCARHCIAALNDDGVILWDNSERDEFAEGMALLAERGFRELAFDGLGPVNPYVWRTSFLYRDDNCLGI